MNVRPCPTAEQHPLELQVPPEVRLLEIGEVGAKWVCREVRLGIGSGHWRQLGTGWGGAVCASEKRCQMHGSHSPHARSFAGPQCLGFCCLRISGDTGGCRGLDDSEELFLDLAPDPRLTRWLASCKGVWGGDGWEVGSSVLGWS